MLAFMHGERVIAAQYAFQVTFTDKNNTPYSLSSPLAYLSPRAMARRTAQGIAIDSTDLPVNQAYIDSVLTLTGGIFHASSRWLNMCMILLPVADSAQIQHLVGKSFISSIKEVGYYGTDLHTRVRNDTTKALRATSSDNAYYGATWGQTQLVNGYYLHDSGYNGEGKLIAVFDAGYIGANTHPGFDSLWAAGKIVDTFDFTFRSTNVFHQDNHGAEVLSTMAGYVPGTYVGTAPRAMYALYITEYNLSDEPLELDNMICAAERADSIGADVITESLTYDLLINPLNGNDYGQTYASCDGKTTVAAIAANIATKKGMLFVATAANDGSGIPGWGNHVPTPGDADSALTIGAVDITGTPASFSSYGPNAAGQVKPDVCGMGVAANIFSVPGSGYGTADGTSFSTPQIAGWATCLWEAHPTATPAQIRQAIIKCASSYSSPGNQLGYGIPNFECTTQLLNVRDTPPPFTPAHWVIATPNPFSDELTLAVSPNAAGDVAFRLTDMAGREVFITHYELNKGNNAPVSISVPWLPAGIYILRAVSATQQQVLKLNKRP